MEKSSITLKDILGTNVSEFFSLCRKKLPFRAPPPNPKPTEKVISREQPAKQEEKPKTMIEYVVVEMGLLFDFRKGYADAQPFEGVPGMLEDLTNDGYTWVYVASSQGIDADNARLKNCGLDKYFKLIGAPESEIVSRINSYNAAFLCGSVSSAGSMAFHGGAVIGATWNEVPSKHQSLAHDFLRAKVYKVAASPKDVKEIMSHTTGRAPTCLPMKIFELFPD